MTAVETGIPQQRHVLLPTVKRELGQLIANAIVQIPASFHQRVPYLLPLLLQHMVRQRFAEQLAEGQTHQHGQAEEQQTDPEGGNSSQGTPA
ncbi:MULTISPECIES: hypothetical protein [Aeromonas]|uniref:hypothetical protein n=1 Tax=Aeromonas TaxID=642 RepID=UPI001F350378|nr:hypothetical protein [Aeromonas salmonicida]